MSLKRITHRNVNKNNNNESILTVSKLLIYNNKKVNK